METNGNFKDLESSTSWLARESDRSRGCSWVQPIQHLVSVDGRGGRENHDLKPPFSQILSQADGWGWKVQAEAFRNVGPETHVENPCLCGSYVDLSSSFIIQLESCHLMSWFMILHECQAWINEPLGCLIGGIPFKYHIMTIGGVDITWNPPQILLEVRRPEQIAEAKAQPEKYQAPYTLRCLQGLWAVWCDLIILNLPLFIGHHRTS